MRVLAAAGVFFASAALAAPPDTVPETAANLRDSLAGGRGAADIAMSLTDGVGPRLSGSEGAAAARRWAVAELSRLGLANVHEEALMEPRWERGAESAEVVAPVRQKLVVTALGGSGATPEAGIEAPVVATKNVESLAALPPETVRGRIVFLTERMERTRDGAGYGKAVPIRFRGPIEARKLGAAAVLIRSVGTSSTRLPHTGMMKLDDRPPLPAAALSAPDADLLERLAGAGPVTVRLALGCRAEPDVPGANVVGEIRGSERPDEIVLLGAHLDSWDLGTGAIDDAAGIGIVGEAARAIAALPRAPRRTIRVVLFANEENGERGGEAYRDAHRSELDRHVAALEMDLGTDRVYRVAALGGPEAQGVVDAAAAVLAPIGVEGSREDASGGADVGALRPFGVPMLDLSQDASRYFDFHHSADDTFDKIDPGNLAQATAATAALAWIVADEPGTLGRIPQEKRKENAW